MINLVSRAFARINSLVNELQMKRFLAVVLVGFLVLTTNIAYENNSKAVTRKIDQALQQNDTQRPQTTGEWNKEARETENAPGERLKRIVGESAEAVKEFGSVYPDTAKSSARGLKNNNN